MTHTIKERAVMQQVTTQIARMFSGRMSGQEASDVATERDSSVQHNAQFLTTVRMMADMEALADDPELLAYAESPGKKGSGEYHRPILATAATLLLGLVVGYYFLHVYEPLPDHRNLQRYVTRIGEQKTITLNGGSRITLNTATVLIVDDGPEWRRVMLQRGEAYFDVAPDPQRPFTVDLGERAVSVLGTQFNILKTQDKFTLAVTEGAVSLHQLEDGISPTAPRLTASEDEAVRLTSAGQRRIEAGMVVEYSLSRHELVAWKAKNMHQLQSWRQGILQFDDVPLYKVVQELNRYSGKKIIIEDPTLSELEFYATLKINDMRGALTAMEYSLPIKVMYHFDRIALVMKDQ